MHTQQNPGVRSRPQSPKTYMGDGRTCTVVFMPGVMTSTACGSKGKSTRKAVVVSPAANLAEAAIAPHSSRLVGMPFSCSPETHRKQSES